MLILTVLACENQQQARSQDKPEMQKKDGVEVIYFHSKQRCITCINIETLTKETLDENFSEELKNGQVIFRIIDISEKQGRKIADAYEVTWSSLFINKWKDGKETRNNITEFAFLNAVSNPKAFKEGVKKQLMNLKK